MIRTFFLMLLVLFITPYFSLYAYEMPKPIFHQLTVSQFDKLMKLLGGNGTWNDSNKNGIAENSELFGFKNVDFGRFDEIASYYKEDGGLSGTDVFLCLARNLQAGNSQAAAMLLESDIEINQLDESGWPPLMLAMGLNDPFDLVETMLERKADPNIRNAEGYTPLIYSAYCWSYERLIPLLVRYGAKPNLKDASGKNAIIHAIFNNPIMLPDFLAIGEDPREKDLYKLSALDYAVIRNIGEECIGIIENEKDPKLKEANMKKRVLNRALAEAVSNNDINEAGRLIKQGASPNTWNESGYRLIDIAAQNRQKEMVAFLLEAHADINWGLAGGNNLLNYFFKNEWKDLVLRGIQLGLDVNRPFGYNGLLIDLRDTMETMFYLNCPLAAAAAYGWTDVMLEMHKAGANTNGTQSPSPLTAAIVMEKNESIRLLIDWGVRPNIRDQALLDACMYGNKGAADILLSNGADPRYKMPNNLTPLHFAAKNGWLSICVKIITKGCDVNIRGGEYGRETTPLENAIMENRLQVASFLIKNGAKCDIKGTHSNVLEYPISKGFLPMLSLLLDAGIEPDAISSWSGGILINALSYNDKNLAKKMTSLLLDHNAKIDVMSTDSRFFTNSSAFAIACGFGWLDIAKRMNGVISMSKIKDSCYYDGLLLATASGSSEVVSWLLDLGTNPSPPEFGKHYESPLYNAINYYDQSDTIKKIVASGVSERAGYAYANAIRPMLFDCFRTGKLELSKWLIVQKKGFNLEDLEISSRAFLFACETGDIGLVKLFTEPGGQAKKPDSKNTAIIYAAQSKNIALVQYLVARGFNLNVSDINGGTALHAACRSGDLDTVRWLIDKGLNVNARNKNNETPIFMTAVNHNRDIADLLISKGADVSILDNNGESLMIRLVPEWSYNPLDWTEPMAAYLILQGVTPKVASTRRGFDTHDRFFIYSNIALNPDKALLDYVDDSRLCAFALELGAKVDTVDSEGSTSLFLAIREKAADSVETLIAAGASCTIKDKFGETPLELAERLRANAAITYALSNRNDENTLIRFAVKHDLATKVRQYLKKKESSKTLDQTIVSRLALIAGASGAQTCFELLCRSLRSFDAKDEKGNTLLTFGVKQRWQSAVDFLVQNKAPINAENDVHETPLSLALANKDTDVIARLVDGGADISVSFGDIIQCVIEAKTKIFFPKGSIERVPEERKLESFVDRVLRLVSADMIGKTEPQRFMKLCSLLIENSSIERVRGLVEKAPSTRLKQAGAQALLSQSVRTNDLDQAKYAIAQGADVGFREENGLSQFHAAALSKSFDIADMLLSRGASVKITDSKEFVSLWQSIIVNNDYDTLDYLLAKGMGVSGATDEGMTPVMLAAEYSFPDMISYLLDKGAKLDEKDSKGRTALIIACTSKGTGEYRKINIDLFSYLSVEALLLRGASAMIKDQSGKTALDYAMSRMFTKTVSILEDALMSDLSPNWGNE